jgi:hypothetical protein
MRFAIFDPTLLYYLGYGSDYLPRRSDRKLRLIPIAFNFYSLFSLWRMRQFPGPVAVLWPFFRWHVIVSATEDASTLAIGRSARQLILRCQYSFKVETDIPSPWPSPEE